MDVLFLLIYVESKPFHRKEKKTEIQSHNTKEKPATALIQVDLKMAAGTNNYGK